MSDELIISCPECGMLMVLEFIPTTSFYTAEYEGICKGCEARGERVFIKMLIEVSKNTNISNINL